MNTAARRIAVHDPRTAAVDLHIDAASRDDIASIATRGPLTPDHVIRTKRVPVVIDGDPGPVIEAFAAGAQSASGPPAPTVSATASADAFAREVRKRAPPPPPPVR